MIKILLVDDYQPKRKRILETILDNHNIKEGDIFQASTIKDARRLLYSNNFDLLILDLVLPVDDSDECHARNSINFLNEININPSINPPIHILGLSGYKDQVEEFNTDFSSKLWNLIDYSENTSSWQTKLTSIIFHLVKTRQQFLDASVHSQNSAVLQFLEENEIPNTSVGLDWPSISNNLAEVIQQAILVPKRFCNGTKAKNINLINFKINSEYDFQNLIHIVLRSWIPSTEPENIAVIFDGNTKYADFSVKGNSLIIEAKYIDSTGKKNDVLKTLEGLKYFYRHNANVKALLFLILYDSSVEIDKYKIEEAFSQTQMEPTILVKLIENALK